MNAPLDITSTYKIKSASLPNSTHFTWYLSAIYNGTSTTTRIQMLTHSYRKNLLEISCTKISGGRKSNYRYISKSKSILDSSRFFNWYLLVRINCFCRERILVGDLGCGQWICSLQKQFTRTNYPRLPKNKKRQSETSSSKRTWLSPINILSFIRLFHIYIGLRLRVFIFLVQ